MSSNIDTESPPPGDKFAVTNLRSATFECTFGRGCEGSCCRNGEPPLSHAESLRIADVLPLALPRLRETARNAILAKSFLRQRRKDHDPVIRVVGGWCAFFNQGCVLHRLGEERGDKFLYKPVRCSLFPLVRDSDGAWRVRQLGDPREAWDLFCLDPASSSVPASRSLVDEVKLAKRVDRALGI